MAQVFSSEDPESLRGPQFHMAWADELGKWKYPQETWDMLQFGLRLGETPRQLVTTTPRPIPLLKALLSDPTSRVARMPTAMNAQNLSPGFLKAMEERYGGTRLGRQEIGGELIDEREGALWKRADLEAIIEAAHEPLTRIVVAGLGMSGRLNVLGDCSVEGETPAGWARAVVAAFRRHEADRVVAEVNQGGEMVRAMLQSIDANLPLTLVRASRGKFTRAEPVAALYEQGRVSHAARFEKLEDQMTDFGPDGLSSGRSPDRLDALVWAITALTTMVVSEPKVRGM